MQPKKESKYYKKRRNRSFSLERRELRGNKCLQTQGDKEIHLFGHQQRTIKLMGTYSRKLSAQKKKKKANHKSCLRQPWEVLRAKMLCWRACQIG